MKDDAMTQPEKLDLRTLDVERLKLALGETVDVGRERYGMNWPGKASRVVVRSP